MGEVIVKDVSTTVGQSNCKLVCWADEEVIRNGFGNLLLVLISIVCCFITSVLEDGKGNNALIYHPHPKFRHGLDWDPL